MTDAKSLGNYFSETRCSTATRDFIRRFLPRLFSLFGRFSMIFMPYWSFGAIFLTGPSFLRVPPTLIEKIDLGMSRSIPFAPIFEEYVVFFAHLLICLFPRPREG